MESATVFVLKKVAPQLCCVLDQQKNTNGDYLNHRVLLGLGGSQSGALQLLYSFVLGEFAY
jgi:hypothetical protein